MATEPMDQTGAESAQRPDVRSRQIGVRLTEAEFAVLEKLAWAEGRTPGEWARELLSRAIRSGAEERIAEQAFTELVGLQLLLMNALQPLLAGQRIGADQFQKLVEQIQATKQIKARELLARRAAKEGESHVRHL
jgi:hypothetical protein